ncbi:putative bifunctional diguanylate cyclase/phosphodiesterase [Paucibacter sp. Y2R2-4]|uniref:putative bifunctional diguanylate cyclase/phosphodiesterase n=1 Tax=Paucibacter sp. Y2R2-4 TaxID=2893553 RepID=UPI0021E4783E|nr:EAL domain-containing protein [Paucibacter sp. Y2R2-4]MCV2350971.1 EAL domain-containing protein [Paucibacter sp. Y2R2-4]
MESRIRFSKRIGTRLGLAFAVLMISLLALAALTMVRLDAFSRAFTRVVGEQAETLESINDVSANAEDAARKLLVLISSERETRVLAYTEIDAANRQLDSAMLLLDQRLPAGERRQAWFNVQQRLKQYRHRYGQTVDLIEADQHGAALDMLGGKTEEALSLLIDGIRSLSSLEQVASLQQAQELRGQIDRDRNTVLLLCLAALAVGGTLALWVTRSIVRPLSLTEAGAREIAAGHYAHRIPVSSRDEVGRLSTAMNTVAEAVGEREQRLLRMANVDMLTGLALRSRFIADGDELLERLSKIRGLAVLMCMDVDRLKTVNSVLGFDAGDALLVSAAGKLSGMLDAKAIFGRLAGGTFVALVPMDQAEDAAQLAEQVQTAVQHKHRWQGQTLDLSVSVGMALYPDHAEGCEALLRRAEQAMFESKRQRLPVSVYNPNLEASRLAHLSLLSDLQEAIEQGQLRQFLQPKVSAVDGRLLGVEALVRWEHPQRGWLPPSEFIPFAESTGRIRQVTQWMLEEAVRTLAAWQAEGRPLSIAVNVSTLDLQDEALPERVEALLAASGVPPHALQLELTETGLLDSGMDPIGVLHSLRKLGVRLAIDDFGTGQSSLAYLQRLPVHELKVDRSFVDRVDGDAKRQELLGSIVKLGHSLGLTVTAEGVENEAELAVIRATGCDLVQGYFIAKPMDLQRLQLWREQRDAQSRSGPLV